MSPLLLTQFPIFLPFSFSFPAREDVKTWFDLLDLDDHITFGGKP